MDSISKRYLIDENNVESNIILISGELEQKR